jgi:uncharacterized membrane protein YdjX (TVP38/TMEM64 family)
MLILRILPILIILTFVVSIITSIDTITVANILNYVPKNYFLAVITILFLYMLKSLTIIVPLMILYIASGIIFSPMWGLLINLVGLFICISVPYWIGFFCGKDLLEILTKKYKNIQKLQIKQTENEWFLSYILRIIGFLPGDIVSLSLGSMKINYKKYISGSLIGLLPRMIVDTFIGETISDPTSPIFLASGIFTFLLSIISIYFNHKYKKNKNINS